MAFDRRRTNGPEESISPDFDEDGAGFWSVGEPRKHRAFSDIRPICLVSQAAGSAYIETERTKLFCAIYGPRQSKSTTFHEKGRLHVEVKFAPFSCQTRKAPMNEAQDRSIAIAVHQALVSSVRLESFPKATVDIFITIIETDGMESCTVAGSIAASTALAQAGIEVLGLVISCSAAVIGGEVWADPSKEESILSNGTFVLACMPALKTITNISQTGRMTPAQLVSCMALCETRCNDIHTVVAQALLHCRQ